MNKKQYEDICEFKNEAECEEELDEEMIEDKDVTEKGIELE